MKNLIITCAASILLSTYSFAEDLKNDSSELCQTSPTVVIDSQEMSISSERAIAETINEMEMDANQAVISQKIASCFNVSTELIQEAVQTIYYEEETLSLENIAAHL